MGVMDGKRGLVVGIVNEHSYAYSIAESLLREGAECLFTHLPGDKMARRVNKAIDQLSGSDPWVETMDARSDEDLDRVFAAIGEQFGTLDFLVHSIAFAEREWLQEGKFTATPRGASTLPTQWQRSGSGSRPTGPPIRIACGLRIRCTR